MPSRVHKSLTAHDGLSDPMISEEGRRFDAGLMCQLSDQQIEDLFKASRAAQMPEYHNSDGSFKPGVDEASVMRQWVQAFKQKREELAKGRCEWKEKPDNLAVIDNPMGLATVPEFLHRQTLLTAAQSRPRQKQALALRQLLSFLCRCGWLQAITDLLCGKNLDTVALQIPLTSISPIHTAQLHSVGSSDRLLAERRSVTD